jgi:hypothetical protein
VTDRSLVEIAKGDIPGFKLTEQVFSELQDNNIPADILTILEDLKEQHYPNQETFVRALEATIGKEQVDWYKAIIVQHARTGVLAKLHDVKDQQYTTEDAFISNLETTIGKEQTEKYKSSILKHVQEQEIVVSSGLGGIFPKGLIVGTVSKVVKQSYGLFQEIEVVPSVDFSKLEEVLIIRRDDMLATQ